MSIEYILWVLPIIIFINSLLRITCYVYSHTQTYTHNSKHTKTRGYTTQQEYIKELISLHMKENGIACDIR